MRFADPRTGFEQIPGGDKNDDGRGVISYEWHCLKKAEKDLSRLSNLYRQFSRLKRHCDAHPGDQQALRYLERFGTEKIGALFNARSRFNDRSLHYRRKMIELADVPKVYRHTGYVTRFGCSVLTHEPEVKIIDNTGSVMILFGVKYVDGSREGCWVLFSNGAINKIRTPDDVLDD